MNSSETKFQGCDFCKSTKYKTIYSVKTKKSFNGSEFYPTSQKKNALNVVKCIKCGLVYTYPLPDRQKVLEQYRRYIDNNYLLDITSRRIKFRQIAKKLLVLKKGGKVLEVGCAAGLFLDELKTVGYEPEGIEPNVFLASWGRKNLHAKIITADVESYNFKNKRYDVVIFWDSLEHLFSPGKVLKNISGVLKPKGILVINYPDIESTLSKIFREYWWFIISSHFYYFSKKTISKYLQKYGFKTIEDKSSMQYLNLAYLFHQLGRYNIRLADFLYHVTKILNGDKITTPYFAGQRTVIAILQNTS